MAVQILSSPITDFDPVPAVYFRTEVDKEEGSEDPPRADRRGVRFHGQDVAIKEEYNFGDYGSDSGLSFPDYYE